jgi:LPXTG-site transpeptidase (sortase) family protein
VEYSHSSASKTSKKQKKLLKSKHFALIFIIVGLLIFSFGASNYYSIRILSFDKVPPAAVQEVKDTDVPVEIMIPSINIDLKVDPGQIKDGIWQISNSEATFLDTSAPPGTGGNTVIYGHNKKVIFGNLPYLSLGQKIVVITKSGKIYNYVASQKYFVDPDRTDLVSPTNNAQLTIYTCWGLFDSQRAVVVAKPVNL